MDLFIGILKITIYIKTDSIVKKRDIINNIRLTVNSRFNTSFVELDSFDDFSNLNLAFLNACSNQVLIESIFKNISNYIKQIENTHIVKEFIQIDKFN